MKRTRAALAIIHALWPGPATPSSLEDTLASEASEPRAPLLTYASRSATRWLMSGSGFLAAPAAAATELVVAAGALVSSARRVVQKQAASNAPARSIRLIILIGYVGLRVLRLNCQFTFFLGADANGFLNVRDEDFAIANLSSFCGLDDH